MAETDTGTSIARSERFSAVTMTSSKRTGAAPVAAVSFVETLAAPASAANAPLATETRQHAVAKDPETLVKVLMHLPRAVLRPPAVVRSARSRALRVAKRIGRCRF